MEQQNCLGIHLGYCRADVVLLGGHGSDWHVSGLFSVRVESDEAKQQEHDWQKLSDLIAAGCHQRQMIYSEVAVALDAGLFMQYNLRSEFTEYRQIAQTIKFDTEEVASTDSTELAMAFEITGRDEAGSRVRVFAAQRKMLSEILESLQRNGFDPVTIQPDVVCLGSFISRFGPSERFEDLYAIFSEDTGYLVNVDDSHVMPIVRTFLHNNVQDKTALLGREIPITLGRYERQEKPNRVITGGMDEGVNAEILAERLGLAVVHEELTEMLKVKPDATGNYADTAGIAVACGAAVSQLGRMHKTDFRPDFMPYQGRKARIEKSLKLLSVSITVLLVAVGVYFQLKASRVNADRAELREKLGKQYSAVMFGAKMPRGIDPSNKLQRSLNRIFEVKSGRITAEGENSVSAFLAYVLEALNSVPASVDLKIDSITVTTKAIILVGNTNGRRHTLSLIDALDKHEKLSSSQYNYDEKAGRDQFRVTVKPKS
ncbi:MAG: type II secretion system protein GspL [Planctomycetota bacterium]